MVPELKTLLDKAHISLILDGYDALFSDFDPRPYPERAISDDFLVEAKRAIREAEPGTLEMRFLIPKHLKNAHEEEIIRDRLHHYFHKQSLQITKETRGLVRNGAFFSRLRLCCLSLCAWLWSRPGGSWCGMVAIRYSMTPNPKNRNWSSAEKCPGPRFILILINHLCR